MKPCVKTFGLCVPLKAGSYIVLLIYASTFVIDLLTTTRPLFEVFLTGFVLYLFFAGMFVWGTRTKKSIFLIPSLTIFVIKFVATSTLMMAQAITAYKHTKDFTGSDRWIIINCTHMALNLMISPYLFLVLVSTYLIVNAEENNGKQIL